MQNTANSENEEARLEALYSYNLLDTLPEAAYDDAIEIAASICKTPVSLISLVDKDRCWFKAKLGLEQSEAPRKIAFAAHAINTPQEITVIEDALEDERFLDCPLVLQDPPMRFYAGTPLVTQDGHALGTLCVIDHVPRKLDKQQLKTLKTLANQIVSQFELQKKVTEISKLNAKLEDLNKDLDSFSYFVSHDLKAPIRAINSFSDIILEEFPELQDDLKEYIGRIQTSGNHMNQIVNDLLLLANASKSGIQKVRTNLSEIGTSIIEKEATIPTFTCHVTPDIYVNCDANLMRVALQNLLSNAIKYSRKEAHPIVKMTVQQQDGLKWLCIEDNGVGYDTNKATNVFQPFQRFHSNKDFEGTGVGLAIVKKVLDKHQMSIHIESEVGKGTKVYCSLPVV